MSDSRNGMPTWVNVHDQEFVQLFALRRQTPTETILYLIRYDPNSLPVYRVHRLTNRLQFLAFSRDAVYR